jgi:hypothetical protein
MPGSRLLALTLAACAALPAGAQVAVKSNLAKVEVRWKKNPGDFKYREAYQLQRRVVAILPPEPRLIDFRIRVLFAGLNQTERDDFLPAKWGVAIVGDTVDYTVPLARGGYFLLPDLPLAREEDATLMFNAQTKPRLLGAAFPLRLGEGNVLPYSDFAKAMREFDLFRTKIPWSELGMREIRHAEYDSLRACFALPGGAILIDGAPAGAADGERCSVLKFDVSKVESGAVISFTADLDNLTLHY